MYSIYNANPDGKNVDDCTVRAISTALGHDWLTTYLALCIEGSVQHDMPHANSVWGAYLRKQGFARRKLPDTCPDCYTVSDFANEHPQGTYILAMEGHVVCVKDGDWLDTWDSGMRVPLYYWERSN